jgi:hypothetical protein
MQRLQREHSRRRCRRLHVEPLEDRRLLSSGLGVFHAATLIHWSAGGVGHSQVAFLRISVTESSSHLAPSPVISAWVHEGILGTDLAFIHDLQGKDATSGNQAGSQGQAPPVVTGSGQSQQPPEAVQTQSPGTGTIGQPPTTTTGHVSPPVTSSSSSTVVTTTETSKPAPTESTSAAPESLSVSSSSTPATAAAPTSTSEPSTTTTTATPRAAHPVAPVAAVTPIAPVAVPATVAVAPPGEPVRPAGSATRPAEPTGRLLALNVTAREAAVTTDNLSGGSVETAVPRRAVDTRTLEAPLSAPGVHQAPRPADQQPSGAGKAEPAASSGSEQPVQADAKPQEADLLTDVPSSTLQGLGLGGQQAYHRLRNLLGDLADSVVVWRVAPLLAAALVGGTAFGVVRRRRRRRLGLLPVPPVPMKDTDTWLPAPTEPPPADLS